jgi:UDP-glucose 4-epimerase
VRLFNCVGPRQSGEYGMVLPRLVGQAVSGKPLTVYGNGRQSRCFAHVLDVVRAIKEVHDTDAALGRVFNVGSETPISIGELAERIIARTGGGGRIEYVAYEDAYEDGFEELGRRQPDTTLLRETTGWSPERTLDDAIDDVIEYTKVRQDQRRRAAIAT